MTSLINGDNEIIANGVNSHPNREDSHLPPMSDEVPVLVVGGGPAGLLMSYMLSKFGSKQNDE